MKRHVRHIRRIAFFLALYGWINHLMWRSSLTFPANQARAAQRPLDDEIEASQSEATKKFREMAKPEVREKAKADLERPPFEFLRSQIAPFDVLPYYKQNHWVMMTVEARSSREDFSGSIRTQPLSLFGSQREMIFNRTVSMDRNTPTRMSFPLFVPPRYMPQKQGKVFDLDLYREGALRPTEIWQANVRAMEPHQMAVLVLARDASQYTAWSKMQATYPAGISRDNVSLERGRYYRFVLPENPEKPLVAPSFLFWTTISHVIWDSFDPNLLDVDQQRAMVDWLHWGGQLTIVGGADSRLGLLRESFLAPYLPADTGGTNKQLDTVALKPLAEAYRPPVKPVDSLTEEEREIMTEAANRAKRPEWAVEPGIPSPYYESALPIPTLARNPVFLTGLRPLPGAASIPLGKDASTIMGAEWRVGRGRVTLLGLNPTEPSLTRWLGMDTFVRRVILRRPEESRPPPRALGGTASRPPMLAGPELSWLRIGARDTGGPHILAPALKEEVFSKQFGATSGLEEDAFPDQETATWIDAAILPATARDQLERASGIRVPSFNFVAKSLGIYLVLLVPVNWLVFRAIGRRELSWAAAPVLALVCALVVERAAAYDLGFTRGRDEIALLEMQADYPRGHLTRFGALAATGRENYQVAFPADLNAVCLPFAYSATRADAREVSSFQFMPTPALNDFKVQPRSVSFYRSEQMVGLPGPIRLVEKDGTFTLENRTRLALHDAVVLGPDDKRFELGEVGAGESRPLSQNSPASAVARSELLGKLDPTIFLKILQDNPLKTRAEAGSWRLVAWSESMVEGVDVTPTPDRVRGFTLVLAHLKSGPNPNIEDAAYDLGSHAYQPPAAPPPVRPLGAGMINLLGSGAPSDPLTIMKNAIEKSALPAAKPNRRGPVRRSDGKSVPK